MIAPELLSNDELERLAYQQNDPLARALADRICDHCDDDFGDPDEVKSLERNLDEAEERADDLATLCAKAADALRADDPEKWEDLIKELERA